MEQLLHTSLPAVLGSPGGGLGCGPGDGEGSAPKETGTVNKG